MHASSNQLMADGWCLMPVKCFIHLSCFYNVDQTHNKYIHNQIQNCMQKISSYLTKYLNIHFVYLYQYHSLHVQQKRKETSLGFYICLFWLCQYSLSQVSTCFTPLSFLSITEWREAGSNGGGMVHGCDKAGPARESVMNFFPKPFAGQAMDSEQSSTALWGMVGLYFKSLAYSLNRWNM